jgi:hypothetical protein
MKRRTASFDERRAAALRSREDSERRETQLA